MTFRYTSNSEDEDGYPGDLAEDDETRRSLPGKGLKSCTETQAALVEGRVEPWKQPVFPPPCC